MASGTPAPTLDHNPLDLIEADLIVAAVTQAGRPGGFVILHLLSHFELAAVAQVLGDAGCPEGVPTVQLHH